MLAPMTFCLEHMHQQQPWNIVLNSVLNAWDRDQNRTSFLPSGLYESTIEFLILEAFDPSRAMKNVLVCVTTCTERGMKKAVGGFTTN